MKLRKIPFVALDVNDVQTAKIQQEKSSLPSLPFDSTRTKFELAFEEQISLFVLSHKVGSHLY